MTQDLKAWLAEMPPESEIEARIEEVEGELELLQALQQVRSHTRRQNGSKPPAEPAPALDDLRKRLSTERLTILRMIDVTAEKRASIPQIVQATGGDRTNIASNMQRMVPARLLDRTGRGYYSLTDGAQALLREQEGGQIGMS